MDFCEQFLSSNKCAVKESFSLMKQKNPRAMQSGVSTHVFYLLLNKLINLTSYHFAIFIKSHFLVENCF